MNCGLNVPRACFECPYPDCINDSTPKKAEKYFLGGGVDERARMIKKARKRQKNLEYYHQKQLDREREHLKEIHRRRRAAMTQTMIDYLSQLDAEIEKHKKGYHDTDQIGMGLVIARQLFLDCIKEMEKGEKA